MIPNEATDLSARRVRWLCSLTDDEAAAFCAGGDSADDPAVHCARLMLHFVRDISLPRGYAWSLFKAEWHRRDDEHVEAFAPLESYVRLMAMYAADLADAGADLADFCCKGTQRGSRPPLLNNREFVRGAIIRFALCPNALSDVRLLELSYSERDEVRHAVAKVLRWRDSPYRREILTRLLEDRCEKVKHIAVYAAAESGDPALLEVMAAKEMVLGLARAGDARGRCVAESWANDENPLSRFDAVALALKLRDGDILNRLLIDPDWEVRCCAILDSAQAGQLDARMLPELVKMHNAEQLTELLLGWPTNDEMALRTVARQLSESDSRFPSDNALARGEAIAINGMRAFAHAEPKLCGAALRIVPEETAIPLVRELATSPEPAARAVAPLLVWFRALRELYPLVAELCLDSDEGVAREAAHAAQRGGMRVGLYGMDTATLRQGSKFHSTPRFSAEWLVRAILAGMA